MSHATPRTTLNSENARRHPAGNLAAEPGDELLNASAVCVDFDVNYWTFQKSVAKELTPHKRAGFRGMLENTFLKSEVRKRLQKPTLTDGRYEMPDGTVRFSFQRACGELGNGRVQAARQTLMKYVREGLITFHWWTSPQTRKAEQWCAEQGKQGLEELRITLKERQATERDGPDGPRLLLKDVLPKLNKLWRKRYGQQRRLRTQRLTRWAEQGCPCLGGKRITLYRRTGCPTWIPKAQYKELVRALSLPRGHYLIDGVPCVGRVHAAKKKKVSQRRFGKIQDAEGRPLVHRAPGGASRRVVPLTSLQCLPGDPPPFDGTYLDGRVNLAKAATLTGLPRNFLKKCVKATAYLPEGRLPSLKQWPPAGRWRSHPEITVFPEDLARLASAIEAASKNKPPVGWKDAHDIAELVGARTLESILAVGALLKEAREAKAIDAWRPAAPIPTRGGGRRRTWFYDPKKAIDYFRNQRDAASGGSPEPATSGAPADKAGAALEAAPEPAEASAPPEPATPSAQPGGMPAAEPNEVVPPTCSPTPRWDGEKRTLFLGDEAIKSYGHNPAGRQIDLLEAFEKECWPISVADPFKDRDLLKQTCKDLNRTLRRAGRGSSVCFGGDGSGEGVQWRIA